MRDTIEGGCFREALAATFRRHRDAGHHLVLMSASVDFYVPEFGRQLGFDQVISTERALGRRSARRHADHCQSSRRGEGALPARPLAERHDGETFAYGNSESDLPHLQLVRYGMLVNGSLAARRAAAELGVACVEWV